MIEKAAEHVGKTGEVKSRAADQSGKVAGAAAGEPFGHTEEFRAVPVPVHAGEEECGSGEFLFVRMRTGEPLRRIEPFMLPGAELEETGFGDAVHGGTDNGSVECWQGLWCLWRLGFFPAFYFAIFSLAK